MFCSLNYIIGLPHQQWDANLNLVQSTFLIFNSEMFNICLKHYFSYNYEKYGQGIDICRGVAQLGVVVLGSPW